MVARKRSPDEDYLKLLCEVEQQLATGPQVVAVCRDQRFHVLHLAQEVRWHGVSYSPSVGLFRGDLSYSLPLLVGFDLVEVDHSGRLSAMGGVGPLMVVESDPARDARLGL